MRGNLAVLYGSGGGGGGCRRLGLRARSGGVASRGPGGGRGGSAYPVSHGYIPTLSARTRRQCPRQRSICVNPDFYSFNIQNRYSVTTVTGISYTV